VLRENPFPKSSSTMRRATGFGAAALSLAAVLAGCGSEGSAAASAGATDRPPVARPATVVAEARRVPDTLVLDATLMADEESQVTPIVPGRVVEVLVERGDHVEEGAPLVRLRDTDYRLSARTARASLEGAAARLGIDADGAAPAPDDTPEVRSAAAELTVAEEALRRAEELATRGVFSPAQLDDARARAARAREAHTTAINGVRSSIASLESARSTLSTASTSVREAIVRAPFAGEIAERSVSVGEYVALATPLVTLVRTDPLRAEVVVPQDQLARIHPDLAIRVSVDAFPDRMFDGTIRYVSASVRRETRGLVAEAVVPNTEGELRPGMFGRVTIDLGTLRDVVAVPESAVVTEAGVSRAFVIRDGTVEERVVQILDRRDGMLLLASGLNGGDEVATERHGELADGIRIEGAPAAAPAAGGN
jgi:membrane fusion protein, multidrug efflux system